VAVAAAARAREPGAETRPTAPAETSADPGQAALRRLALLGATLLGLLVAGRASGAASILDVQHIGRWVRGAGVLGWAIIAGVMAVGEVVHVPAVVTYSACIMIYGKLAGFFVGWFAVMVSVSFSFALVRAVGGDSLIHTKNKRMQRMLAQLDEKPVVTILLLRIVLFAAPALNFALALSRISFYHYFAGSAVGVVPPLIVFALAVDWFVSTHSLLVGGGPGESMATPASPLPLGVALVNATAAPPFLQAGNATRVLG